jgi:hypothetical protein
MERVERRACLGCWRGRRGCVGVGGWGGEEVTEDGGGGEGVAALLFFTSGEAGAGELPLGVDAGEAFILEEEGVAGAGGEAFGQGADAFGLWSFGVVHVEGESDDERVGFGDLAFDVSGEGADPEFAVFCADGALDDFEW